MADAVTEAMLKAAKFELALHMKLNRGGCIYVYRCRDFPRLSVRGVRESADVPIVQTFYVDARQCATLAAAAAALNADPAIEGDAG